MSKRNKKSYTFTNDQLYRLLYWTGQFEYFTYFNGNNYPTLHNSFPHIIFVGKKKCIESNENSFIKLSQLLDKTRDWIYGYFSYDLKNEIEALESKKPVSIPVNNLGFYEPEFILYIGLNELTIETLEDPDDIFNRIFSFDKPDHGSNQEVGPLVCKTAKRQYIHHVEEIKADIVNGEYYEMNYCIEFTANVISLDPLQCYQKLNSISPMPFSAFMRIGNTYLISASPERFLKKEGQQIISQPIKGTIRRSSDSDEDELLKKTLQSSEKEKAENLMIVDLVRNDLAKSAKPGSVHVDELFGIYSFQKVHQMISTVSAILKKEISITDIIKHAFPMGSMTGAPKIRVMQAIESFENSSRGLYSGAVGFFTPNNDFDFNVVIRSIIYNAESKTISFHVGSAITCDSDPEYEYNECLLKAESLLEVLSK